MFARFVCALLGFRAREFPAKSEKNPGHLSLTEGRVRQDVHYIRTRVFVAIEAI